MNRPSKPPTADPRAAARTAGRLLLPIAVGTALSAGAAPQEPQKKPTKTEKPATQPAKSTPTKATGAGARTAESTPKPANGNGTRTPMPQSGAGTTTPAPANSTPAPASQPPAPGTQAAPGASAPGATQTPPMPAVKPEPIQPAPPGMIRLDFRGSDIDTVLQAFAMAYKLTVVKDPAVSGRVTIIETAPLDREKAFKVLQAVLDVRGFTAVLDGSILKVMSLKRAVASTPTVRLPARDPGAVGSPDDQVVTEVIPLSNAEAGVLAKDLQPLLTEGASIIGSAGANALIITDAGSNIDRVRVIISALDKGAGNNELEIFHLKHVPAKQMTEVINNLFKQIAPRTPAAPMGPPGQPQPPPQPGQQRPADPRPAVAAVEDERTNSVIVVGSADNLKRVGELVRKLDDELNPHTETKLYTVKYADAVKLAELINNALVGGQAGQSQQNQSSINYFNPFERRAQGTQATSYSAGQTRIVADQRTNTLLITASNDIMKTVDDLLVKLDQPVEYETTTFAIPLKNGNAEDMAYILAQAFGTNQQGFGGFPFFGFFDGGGGGGAGARRDRRIQRRVNDQNQRSDATLPNSPETGFVPGEPRGPQIADASGGTLPPELQRLAQFYYYDSYYGARGRGSDATTGRNASGRYVNLLQLRGNVLVTPERNTNSLIITTSPENAQAVRELVEQLDVPVRQVLLEALVAEVSLDRQTKFGIDYLFENLRNRVEGVFPVLPGSGPLGAEPLASGLRATILRGDFRAIITAVGRDEKVRILSTPRVFTSNNQEAEIEVTDSIPYLEGTTVGFGGQTSSRVNYKEVGLILNVTPRITVDGNVTVDVYQEDSNLLEFRNVGQDAVAPLTTQRVTDTSVSLRNGDTLVLSGLQRTSRVSTQNKIPLLGDIPVLGNLFRSTSKQNKRTELVVFLTPRVVNGPDEARHLSGQELQRLQKRVPEAGPRIPPPPPMPEGGALTIPDPPKKEEPAQGEEPGQPRPKRGPIKS